MKTLYPFEISELSPRDFYNYQTEIEKQSELIHLHKYLLEFEIEVKEKILNNGMTWILNRFNNRYNYLCINDIKQLIYTSITWSEDLNLPSLEVALDGNNKIKINAKTY